MLPFWVVGRNCCWFESERGGCIQYKFVIETTPTLAVFANTQRLHPVHAQSEETFPSYISNSLQFHALADCFITLHQVKLEK